MADKPRIPLLDPANPRRDAVIQFVKDMVNNQLMLELDATPEQIRELLSEEVLKDAGFDHLIPPRFPHAFVSSYTHSVTEKSEWFSLTVDPGQSLEDLRDGGWYDQVNSDIVEAHFPMAPVETQYTKYFVLIRFKGVLALTSGQVLYAIGRDDAHATLRELLTFSKTFTDGEGDPYKVTTMHPSARDSRRFSKGQRLMVCGVNDRKSLELSTDGDFQFWGSDVWFLCVVTEDQMGTDP